MRGYVASWFFPPSTSSEGIVTYKLLRRSGYEYDVCCSLSDLWGYKSRIEIDTQNIRVYPLEGDSINDWVDYAVETFEKLNRQNPYDFFMTRSFPPESIHVGLRIKEKHPDLKWICSMGDPIANNPYELVAYVDENAMLNDAQKQEIRQALVYGEYQKWAKQTHLTTIQLLISLKELEDAAVDRADLIICPSECQIQYMMRARPKNKKMYAVPHTFEKNMFTPGVKPANDGKIVLTYLGSTDERRTLKPLIRALKWIRDQEKNTDELRPETVSYRAVVDKLRFRLIGSHPRDIKDMVIDFYLDEQVEFIQDVSYLDSLRIMQESDWLIHTDAYFRELQPGGSIFFAGKLADYLGSNRPILAFIGEGTPADLIVKGSGGVVVYDHSPEAIAAVLKNIANGSVKPNVSEADREEYCKRFDAENVAKAFDNVVENMVKYNRLPADDKPVYIRQEWYPASEAEKEKLLSICVPSYNVQNYLDRCLSTLVKNKYAAYLDIIVVNDGSKDKTLEIAKAYEAHYPGIVSVIDKSNGGHGSTINTAIKQAKGRYFRVVDADDWVNEEALEKLLGKILDENIQVDLISANYDHINIDTAEMTPWTQEYEPEFNRILHFDETDYKHSYYTMHASFFRTDVYRKSGMELQEHTFYVDVEYMLFPIPYVQTVMFTNLHIYRYCQGNAEQSVFIPNMVNRFDQHDRVMKRVLSYYHDTEMDVAHKEYMKEILCKLLYTHYALMLVYDQDMARGLLRGKDFDAYLGQLDPQLAERMRSTMPYLKMARAANFSILGYQKKLNSSANRLREKVKLLIKKMLRRLFHTKLVRKFLNSGFATKLKESKLGRSSLGKKIKKLCM